MNKFLSLLSAIFLVVNVWAQAPQNFSYQAVVRGTDNALVSNKKVGMKISLLQGSETGKAVYVETHTPTSNTNGLVSIAIGGGTKDASSTTFASIDWSKGPYFVKTETDPTGGTSYSLITTSQLLSVPYAIHAKTAESIVGGSVLPSGGTNGQGLTICDGVPTWTTGGICPGKITALNCAGVSVNGLLNNGAIASKVSFVITYSGGNGGSYSAQSTSSTGVVGLTATLQAGSFATGNGSLTFTVSGTPTSVGNALFSLTIAGQVCSVSMVVQEKPSTIGILNCAGVSVNGLLNNGAIASNVSFVITYSGGNGGSYSAQSTSSTGVVGLTATLQAGSFATGNGSLTFTVSGTPTSVGNALFSLTIAGQVCSVSMVVTIGIPGPNITDAENNTYKTVTIGTQTWMAENLKVTKYNDGTAIPNVTGNTEWQNNTSGAWAYYNNDVANNAKYGKLYNWYAVSKTSNSNKNVCPTGWHVPTDAEWTVLTDYLGGESVAGGKMKEVGTTSWNSPNTDATNTSLFSALPGGNCYVNGNFNNIGIFGLWWSSTETNADSAWNRYLPDNDGIANRSNYSKSGGFSVRCLRD